MVTSWSGSSAPDPVRWECWTDKPTVLAADTWCQEAEMISARGLEDRTYRVKGLVRNAGGTRARGQDTPVGGGRVATIGRQMVRGGWSSTWSGRMYKDLHGAHVGVRRDAGMRSTGRSRAHHDTEPIGGRRFRPPPGRRPVRDGRVHALLLVSSARRSALATTGRSATPTWASDPTVDCSSPDRSGSITPGR